MRTYPACIGSALWNEKLADVEALRDDADQRGWDSEVTGHEQLIERLQTHLGRIDVN